MATSQVRGVTPTDSADQSTDAVVHDGILKHAGLDADVPQHIEGHLAAVPEATDVDLTARFERDVIPFVDTLFGVALRMTRHRADAEDLVQDTMAQAHKGFGAIERGTNLKAWLFGIQASTHINRRRQRMRQPNEVPTDTIYERRPTADAERSPRALNSAEVAVLESLPDDDIRNVLDALPLELRMAVYYADVEGLAYQEISDITSTPLGTVMSRIRRGRSQLRVLLAALAADRGHFRVQQRAG